MNLCIYMKLLKQVDVQDTVESFPGQTCANSVHFDQMLRFEASDHVLLCLKLVQ